MSNSSSEFSELKGAISSLAPQVSLPWLPSKAASGEYPSPQARRTSSSQLSPLLSGHTANASREAKKVSRSPSSPLLTGHRVITDKDNGSEVSVVYSPLQVKKTKLVPSSKKSGKLPK